MCSLCGHGDHNEEHHRQAVADYTARMNEVGRQPEGGRPGGCAQAAPGGGSGPALVSVGAAEISDNLGPEAEAEDPGITEAVALVASWSKKQAKP